MTKILVFALIATLTSLNTYAASTTVGVIDDQTGDLFIQILDDPNSAPPYDAASLWTAMAGTEPSKFIKSDSTEIKCSTSVSEPQRRRFGSCSIEIKAGEVVRQDVGFGVLLNGADALSVLAGFTGAEDPGFPREKELRLANNKLWITAHHPMKLFSLLIMNELMH